MKNKAKKLRYPAASEYIKIIHSLSEVNKLLTLTLNARKIFSLIVNSVAKITEAKAVTLRILSEDRKKLILEASGGISREHSQKKVIKSDEGIAGLALKQNKPVLSADITKDKRYRYFTYIKKEKIKSLLSVPLSIRNKKVGVLSIYHEKLSFYTKEHAKILSIFAEQSAVALELAQLFEGLHQNYFNTIKTLVSLIELKDKYTHGHSQKVQEYSINIARGLGLSKKQQEIIQYAAFLHDIGKIGISSKILNKKKPLTSEEWGIIRQHPINGAEAIKKLRFLNELVPIILHHHEHYDGSGYPDHKKGTEIPLGARILAVADAFDAMTSERPYRKAYSKEEAIKEIKRLSGIQFDPQVVNCLVRVVKLGKEITQKSVIER